HALVRANATAGFLQHPNIIPFQGSLDDRLSIRKAIQGCEQVYHVAGFAKLWARDRNSFYETNVTGTANVLAEALECGVKKVVYTSSCAVFGPSVKEPLCESDPRITAFCNDYDLSKYIAECRVKEYARSGLFVVIVNPSRVYGPGIPTRSNYITEMIKRCIRGELVLLPNAKGVLANYAFIDDVVEGHILAMQKGISGERYILGGENVSYHRVFSDIRNEIKNAKLIAIPQKILKALSWIEIIKNKCTGSEPAFTPSVIERFFRDAALSSKKAIIQLDYQITPFREGIHQTIINLKMNSHA
ncbi:MAG: NAD-dependent epimerase/dehydratase family protein, partial [Bacteroidetes bacterium]|nr:NAD-dependent epimerase/dehydratase family protein [Bacteroidota bacterium]